MADFGREAVDEQLLAAIKRRERQRQQSSTDYFLKIKLDKLSCAVIVRRRQPFRLHVKVNKGQRSNFKVTMREQFTQLHTQRY